MRGGRREQFTMASTEGLIAFRNPMNGVLQDANSCFDMVGKRSPLMTFWNSFTALSYCAPP